MCEQDWSDIFANDELIKVVEEYKMWNVNEHLNCTRKVEERVKA